jgi:hypothetical protein
MNHLTTSIVQSSVPDVTLTCFDDGLNSASHPPVVVPHFDNHPLATRPVYMDDNARPHRSRGVTAYLQSEVVTYVPWPAMSPDLNHILL